MSLKQERVYFPDNDCPISPTQGHIIRIPHDPNKKSTICAYVATGCDKDSKKMPLTGKKEKKKYPFYKPKNNFIWKNIHHLP